MANDEFERLNTLSQKAINETASQNELKELSTLVEDWNKSVQFNLTHGLSNLRHLN